LENAKTTDIDSEELNIFERKKNFDEISKRLEKEKELLHISKGNTYKFNMYIKKLEKMAKNGKCSLF
jgi:hypothetical protein